jgi:hypothetical protein
LVSRGVLEPLSRFDGADPAWNDFVLLEWMMALELMVNQRKIKAILPLFMGAAGPDGTPGDFFAEKANYPLLDRQAPFLKQECRRYLEKAGLDAAALDASLTETLTVKQAVDTFLNYQAVVFHNDQDIANAMARHRTNPTAMDHRATWAMIDDGERRRKQWMEAELEVCVQRVTKLVQDHVLQLEAEEITRNESDGSGGDGGGLVRTATKAETMDAKLKAQAMDERVRLPALRYKSL